MTKQLHIDDVRRNTLLLASALTWQIGRAFTDTLAQLDEPLGTPGDKASFFQSLCMHLPGSRPGPGQITKVVELTNYGVLGATGLQGIWDLHPRFLLRGRLSTDRKSGEKVKTVEESSSKLAKAYSGDRCASSLSAAALTSFVFGPGALVDGLLKKQI